MRRVISTLLVATAAAGGAVVAVQAPAAANDNVLWVGTIGETHGTFGANAVVRIWGDLRVKTYGCAEDGVNDFVYPTSNVYLVPPGGGTGELTDVTGGRPNTVVQYASVFDDEVIAMTQPGGTLPAGTYDVVFDTCQDGRFDPEDDTVFPGAVTVELPAVLPAPDAALTSLKNASQAEYESWKKTRTIMNAVWKQVEKAIKGGCKAGNPWACAMKYANYFGPIKKSFDQLLVNQGLHYLAIYEDPPNPDYQHAVGVPAADGTDALAGEAALTQALLDAVEAYKGAQQAGDAEWALVHARTVRDLHDALAAQAAASRDQLADLAGLYDAQADEGLKAARDYLSRVRRAGLTPDEKHTLRDNGLTAAQVTAFESDLAATTTPTVLASDVRGVLEEQRTTHAATIAALAEGRAAWQQVVAALEADTPADQHPVAAFDAPATVVEGTPVGLDASSSTGAASYAWDLDGDGDFDDATGATPSVSLPDPGTALVGLRVRDSADRTAYAWRSVDVTARGTAPTVAGTPDTRLRTVVTGSTTSFAVAVSDDAGTPQVAWTVDGQPAGTGSGLSWTAPSAPGVHEVVATATDADGHTGSFAWDVDVHRPDADGDGWSSLLDCDETDAAVHPGQTEFLGNGIDDDCDDASPDAPPGGLTGKVYGWGNATYGALGTGVTNGTEYTLPTAAALGDDVVQVEAMLGNGYAVLADGTVRAWGVGSGGIGDGQYTHRYSPVQPLGPGGVGLLSGVRRISASLAHVAAVTTNGKVLTWGNQTAGTLGDGSTVASRPYPDYVLTSAGGSPLTGVRSVEAGHAEDYALMEDGTVKAWGSVTCMGVQGGVATPFPQTVPGLTDIKQITTSQAVTLFLRKDGAVLSCGGTDEELGRPWNFTDKSAWKPLPVTGLGAGSTVVDISITGDAAMAMKEDGSVYLWGRNTNAGLAPLFGGDAGVATAPTLAPLPAGPPAVDVDNSDSVTPRVIRADGSLVLWGGNTFGAGGTGTSAFITSPIVLDVAGRTVLSTSGSNWAGFALTRPKDDPALELPARWVKASVADADLTESGGGAFTVTLDHALLDDVALTWELGAGTAGGDDADLRSGTLVIPAGQTSGQVPVTVVDDATDEDDETVVLSLTGARLGLTIDRAQAIGTIADDDAAPVVSVEDRSIEEGGTSLTDTPVTFRLSQPSGKEVVATYTTVAGTASAGSDYVGSTATIRFAPGETEDVVHLAVVGDAEQEPDETFGVDLTAATNASTGAGGTVRIRDDEVLALGATGSTVVEGEDVRFTVAVTPAPLPGVEVSVPWRIGGASGTATLTADAPSAVVSTGTLDDDVVEDIEPVALELGDAVSSDGRTVLRGEVEPSWVTDNDTAGPGNQAPVVSAGPAPQGVEGSAIALDGTVTDDADGVTSQWSVAGPCTVAGSGADTTVTCRQDGEYAAELTATDAGGLTASGTTVVTVANAAPVIGTATVDGLGASVAFTDAGADDTHTCRVAWGDGTPDGVVSGAVSPCHLTHAYTPGTWTARVTVTDGDGASDTVSRTVTVAGTAWPWRGFLQPVDNAPAVNVVKAGQAVPVKFGLGAYRGMDIFAGGSPSSGVVACGGGEPDLVESTTTAGASTLTYDAGTDTYQYVWKTQKSWSGQCRRLVVELADGTSHWAEFQLR